MVPKNNLYCIKLTQESKILRGRNKIWCTLHIPPSFHLTSHSKLTHDASRHPAWWRRWEDARALDRAQEAWPRCHLEAYDGGGYDVACCRVRTGSRHAIPRPFQPKPRGPIVRFRPPGRKMKAITSPPPPNEYCRFSLLNTEPLRLPPAVRAHTPAHTD
jgi:hypothetical protein